MCELEPWTSSSIPAILDRWSNKRGYSGRFSPNWFLPVHLGGYGFDPKFGNTGRVTRGQRRLAAQFVNNPKLVLFRILGSSKLAMRTAAISGAIMRPRLIVGDYDCSDSEELFDDDPWLSRLAYATRMSVDLCSQRALSGAMPDRVVRQYIRHDYRMKPMSLKNIEIYRHGRLIVTKSPACPPIGGLNTFSPFTILD
jgi:hypothetical protein